MLKEGLRRLFKLLIQVMLVVTAFNLAIFFRHDGSFPEYYIAGIEQILCAVVVIKLVVFVTLNLLSGWWRYASLHDLVQLVKANVAASLALVIYFQVWPSKIYPISVAMTALDGMLCFLLMSGACVAVRIFRESFAVAHKSHDNGREQVIIVGAGAAAQSIARDIQQNPHLNWKVVGFVDQEKKRLNQQFQGISVLAPVTGLKNLLGTMSINYVLLANPSLCHKEIRNIVDLCREYNVKSKILPNVETILNGGVSIHHVRDVNLEDLLGRPAVTIDISNINHYLRNKRVMVTGAAGSIGSEICRQVSDFGANCIILIDNSETPLFNIDRELRKKFPNICYVPYLSDVCDARKVDDVFNSYRPEVVFHAAAYKHVPMAESNPLSVISNNVVGTQVLANAADRYHVKNFVMISTDKAVNPTNIMGASKRVAELYIQALADRSKTKMVAVRFGNVLGSNGSVVPIFQEQIRNGGPVTVTDPRVTRFFMTIPEAVQLVLQAGSMGEGGEIFVLDMGEQINIANLAKELIRLSGMIPNRDIDIEFTGLRPGEKLYEELHYDREGVLKTNHEKIHKAHARVPNFDLLIESLKVLDAACKKVDFGELLSALTSIVPEYSPDPAFRKQKTIIYKPIKSKIIKLPRSFAKPA